jgi:hypothetical protein
MLVPADLCQGVYGMNLRRLHLTLAKMAGGIPRPWYAQDVGFASPGRSAFQNGAFEVTGNGNLALRPDPFEQYKDHMEHDAFHFVFQRVDGPGELEAKLAPAGTDSGAGAEASAGLMLREAARYGYLTVLHDGSAVFQWRDDGRVSRSPAQSHVCPAGCLLKIVRRGNNISAFLSTSERAWKEVGSHTFSQPLSRSVTLGMAATSDSPSTFPRYATHTSRFDQVRLQSKRMAAN